MFFIFLVEKGIVCSTTEIFFVLLAVTLSALGIYISVSLWTVSNILLKFITFALLGVHSLILLFCVCLICSKMITFIFFKWIVCNNRKTDSYRLQQQHHLTKQKRRVCPPFFWGESPTSDVDQFCFASDSEYDRKVHVPRAGPPDKLVYRKDIRIRWDYNISFFVKCEDKRCPVRCRFRAAFFASAGLRPMW